MKDFTFLTYLFLFVLVAHKVIRISLLGNFYFAGGKVKLIYAA